MMLIVSIATMVGALASAVALADALRERRAQTRRSEELRSAQIRHLRRELAKLDSQTLGKEFVMNGTTHRAGWWKPTELELHEALGSAAIGGLLLVNKLASEPLPPPSRKDQIKARFSSLKASRAVPEVPTWALRPMPPEDRERYYLEWGAHLHQLVEEGEIRQARRDRRRFIVVAITLAVVLRVRRVLGRAP